MKPMAFGDLKVYKASDCPPPTDRYNIGCFHGFVVAAVIGIALMLFF